MIIDCFYIIFDYVDDIEILKSLYHTNKFISNFVKNNYKKVILVRDFYCALNIIKYLPNVKLKLDIYEATDNCNQYIFTLRNNLIELKIHNFIADGNKIKLDSIKLCKNLIKLNLPLPFFDFDLDYVVPNDLLDNLTKLKKLYIGEDFLLESLKKLIDLEKLSIMGNNIKLDDLLFWKNLKFIRFVERTDLTCNMIKTKYQKLEADNFGCLTIKGPFRIRTNISNFKLDTVCFDEVCFSINEDTTLEQLKLFPNLEGLHMSDNNIIKTGLEYFTNLKHLQINQISNVSYSTLQLLTSVEELELDTFYAYDEFGHFCEYEISEKSIDPKILDYFPQITKLTISSDIYLDKKSFQNLKRLVEITIYDNSFIDETWFLGMNRLHTIHFDNCDNINITNLLHNFLCVNGTLKIKYIIKN